MDFHMVSDDTIYGQGSLFLFFILFALMSMTVDSWLRVRDIENREKRNSLDKKLLKRVPRDCERVAQVYLFTVDVS